MGDGQDAERQMMHRARRGGSRKHLRIRWCAVKGGISRLLLELPLVGVCVQVETVVGPGQSSTPATGRPRRVFLRRAGGSAQLPSP